MEITVDGVVYVPKVVTVIGYTMIRTEEAGVFYGRIEAIDEDIAHLLDARRVWYWSGASTLSELATEGTSSPDKCKFPCAVPSVTLHGVIEEIPMTKKAKESLDRVAIWTQH